MFRRVCSPQNGIVSHRKKFKPVSHSDLKRKQTQVFRLKRDGRLTSLETQPTACPKTIPITVESIIEFKHKSFRVASSFVYPSRILIKANHKCHALLLSRRRQSSSLKEWNMRCADHKLSSSSRMRQLMEEEDSQEHTSSIREYFLLLFCCEKWSGVGNGLILNSMS